MEWRHTLEILTKDIQDIEKLVGSLQNSAASPSIDLDLALSKLRNVYEVLTMIKEDQMEEKRSMYAAAKAPAAPQPPPAPATEPRSEAPPPASQVEKPDPLTEQRRESTPSPEEGPGAAEDRSPASVNDPTAAEEEPAAAEKEPAASEAGEPATHEATGPGKENVEAAGKAILAEKFSAASSINDNLAGKRPAGTESKLAGKPIDNIHRNIGINDRFLIIRELFKGDADSFRDLINELDEAGDLQKARDLLQQRFPDTTEHEGLDILQGLIQRRFTKV